MLLPAIQLVRRNSVTNSSTLFFKICYHLIYVRKKLGLGFGLAPDSVDVATGRVKWFNNNKGYGFIVLDETGQDVFAHYSSIQGDGYRTLSENEIVDFEIEEGDKGLHAINIVRRGESDSASDEDQESE